MATKEDFETVASGIEAQGFFTALRWDEFGGFNLACASKQFEDGSLGGNSFWIWLHRETGNWFISTWAPCYYQFPPHRGLQGLVNLIGDCLSLSNGAIATIASDIVSKWELTIWSEDEFDTLYYGDLRFAPDRD